LISNPEGQYQVIELRYNILYNLQAVIQN
jgi:hypothetical protein